MFKFIGKVTVFYFVIKVLSNVSLEILARTDPERAAHTAETTFLRMSNRVSEYVRHAEWLGLSVLGDDEEEETEIEVPSVRDLNEE